MLHTAEELLVPTNMENHLQDRLRMILTLDMSTFVLPFMSVKAQEVM